jgi:hypothetical protein
MLRRRKHGTTDQLALPHQYRQSGEIAETVRSAPGRDPRMARFIRILSALARESHNTGGASPASGLTRALPAVSFGQLRDHTRKVTPVFVRILG